MKQIINRIFSLILAILLCFLPSCSAGTQEPETNLAPSTASPLTDDGTADETEETINSYAEKVASLPDADFQGAAFRIATDSTDLVVNASGASLVGKEQYLRNLAVEEKYNIKLTLTDESGLSTIGERIRTEAMAGSSFCDLVILQSSRFQDLVASDLLHNVRTVPYLELSGKGIHDQSVAATTLGAMTYGFSGDFIYQPDGLYAVFFNKTLLSQTALPDLYQLVRDNQWDFENFVLYAEEVFSVSLASGTRISGFNSTDSREGLINALWAAGGQRFLGNDYGTRPFLDYNNETTDVFIDSVQRMLFQTTAYSEATGTAVSAFSSGEAFMMIAPLSTAYDLVGKGVDWGIVPLPKQDINQSAYYSYMNQTANYAGFVVGTPDLNLSGMVTTALFRCSDGMTQKLASATYLNLCFHSITDVEMLERIMSAPYYDPVMFFSGLDASFTASTQTLLYRVISSEGKFGSLYTQYTKMFEKYLNENF